MAITHIEDEGELNEFVELFADAFGLEIIDLGGDCITIMPGDHMLVPDLPHLPEDGFMATVNRDVALSRDDVQFLSWEHPFIDQALRSEERREGKSVDLGGRRVIKKKKM